jgi:hypothetical protein
MIEKIKEFFLIEFYVMFLAAQTQLSEKSLRNGDLGLQEKAKAYILYK